MAQQVHDGGFYPDAIPPPGGGAGGRQDAFLTVKAVAVLYQVDEKTVYRWIRRRLIKATRFGRTIRIKKSEAMRIHEQQYQPPDLSADPAMG